MVHALAHRGPDHQDVLVDGPIGLGHRRLAIIDLAPRSNQPMVSADGRHVVVFNGEIYNFRELRRWLEGRGETFSTTSDTEVLLAAFRRDGPTSFARLNGMFALAIWDRKTETLVLARDRFGQKPLYVRRTARGLIFGSEIKAILESGDIPRGLDFAGLHEFAFFGNALGKHTLFAGIEKLLAGSYVECDAHGVREQTFFRVDDVRAVHDDVDTATARVAELLDRAVERHLVADVPVGAFLSGGIDSSAITLLASKRARLTSYSAAFDGDPGELPRARGVAERAGTDHHELVVRGANMPDVVRALTRHHDQPFGDAANVPLYLLAKELLGKHKVVLQGDGGDEMFAGYRRYNVLSFDRFWRSVARGRPALERLPPHRTVHRLARFLTAAGEPDPGRKMALLLTEDVEHPSPTRLFSPELRAAMAPHDPFARYQEMQARLADRDVVQRMLHTDTTILLPDIFCEKVDRATMAHGLEVRLPFLDNDLTDYVLGVSSSLKVRRLQKKWLLRRALRGTVPDTVLDAPKRGFGVPYGAWLRGPLRPLLEEVLFGEAARARGWFDERACRAAFDAHVSGAQNNGFLLYKALSFGLFAEAYT